MHGWSNSRRRSVSTCFSKWWLRVVKVVQELDTNQPHLLLPLRNLLIRVNHNEVPPPQIRASHSGRHPTRGTAAPPPPAGTWHDTDSVLQLTTGGLENPKRTHKHTHVSQEVALSPWKVFRVWEEVWKRFLGAAAATADQSVDVVKTAERLNFLADNLLLEISRKNKTEKRRRRQRRKNKEEGEKNCNKTFYGSEMLKS